MMLFLLLLTLSFIGRLAQALPQVAPATTNAPNAASAVPAPAATYSVEVVTLEYIAGNSTFADVETYTDYGTALPSDIIDAYGTGVTTADLPIVSDPCGPAKQDPYTPPTCNADESGSSTDFNDIDDLGYDPSYVYQVATPEPYGVQCLNSSSSTAGINTSNCKLTKVDICNKIRSKYSPHGKWIWSSIGGAGCARGYWLPQFAGSAPAPEKTRCEDGIYGSMLDLCTSTEDNYFGVSNIAAVNLRQLPSTNGTGAAVNVGYPSYIIAPVPVP